ncbi:MAG: ABC transporter ATP-binding protein [Flavobacteriales bacterium]|nr:ABC transporter ATP-binding protein [Flavobacteriales bacterium]
MSKQKISFSKIFKTIIWPKRKLIFIGLILITLGRLSGLVLPAATKYLVDDVLLKHDFELFKIILFVVTLAIVVQAITSYLVSIIISVEGQRFISELRVQVQKKLLNLPISFFDNHNSGALVSRVMNDVEGVRNLVGTGLIQLVGGAITSIISLVLLIKISLTLTLYVLVPLIIFGVISFYAFKKIRPIFKERRKIESEVTGRLTESLGGIRIIKGFNASNYELSVFEKGVTAIFNNVKSTLTASALIFSLATLLLGFASVAIMGIGGYKIMNNELTLGDFLSFTLYLGFLVAPIVQMSNISTQLTEAFSGLDRTEELMNIPSESDNKNRTENLKSFAGNFKFDDVSFSYQDDKLVLHHINFEAPSGTITALVGSSGSGKSTIANLVASFLEPTSGKIYIDNVDLSTVLLDSYRKNIGLVLQDDFLFEGTIKENILFSKPTASDKEVNDAVKMAYVNEFTDRFEDGLNTMIGERGVKLSGGQRQRVAIARAILANPKLLILDEATSSLDSESEMMVQESLKELMKGRTTFVIAHRLSTVKMAHQILVVEGGKIVERGTHDELINSKGRYFNLFTYQSRI